MLYFQTAWSAPHPILERLTEMFPGVEMEHEWADEDIGQNCGRYSYRDGERIEEYFPESEKEAIEFACRMWECDPADRDLCLNAAETKYICVENEEFQKIELLGKPALFSNDRLTDADIPQGMYCYHLRHSDDGGRFCSVEPKAGVNHGGRRDHKRAAGLRKTGIYLLYRGYGTQFYRRGADARRIPPFKRTAGNGVDVYEGLVTEKS